MSRGESKVELAQTGCKRKMLKCASWKNGQDGRIGSAHKSAGFCKDRRCLFGTKRHLLPSKSASCVGKWPTRPSFLPNRHVPDEPAASAAGLRPTRQLTQPVRQNPEAHPAF